MLESGQVIPIKFKNREFRAVVIDPDGFGYNRPTIGVGYRAMSRHTDVPVNTGVVQNRARQGNTLSRGQIPSGHI